MNELSQAPPTIGDANTNETPVRTEAELLQEQLDAREKERLAKKAAREAVLQTPRLKQQIVDEDALAAAEEQLGDNAIATYKTADGLVIVKRPEPMRFRKYQAITGKLIGNNSESANAQFVDEAHKLTLQCLVHPSKAQFDALVEKYSGLPMILAGKISDLAAGRTREDAEK